MKRKEPLYIKICEEIRIALAKHKDPAEPIPTELEFCKRFKASRGTVRKAIEALANEGLIHRISGKGSFLGTGMENSEKRHLFTKKEIVIVVFPCSEDLEKNNLSIFVFFDMLRGVTKACEVFGFQMHLIERPAVMNPDFGRQCANEIEQHEAEGIILFGGYEKEIEELKKKNYPYVLILGHLKSIDANYVSVDTEQGVENAVESLINMGHRKIGFISGGLDLLTFQLRLNGYKAALEKHEIEYSRNLVTECIDGSIEAAKKATAKLLKIKSPPTALFCATDIRAMGAMEAAKERGMKIPNDISIIGFDNIKESSKTNPPLTTVEHPRFDLGYKSIELLDKLISGRQTAPTFELISAKLIKRSSCASVNLI
jgi:LacI family transcriptional regulator, repressor for deo operon, udp, cdd, tsx, nupC, and nupG